MRLVKHLAGTAHLFAACWVRWLYKFYLCFRCVPVLLLLLALLRLLLLIYLFIYLFARQHNFSKVIKWGQWVGLYLWPKDLKLTSFCHHPPLLFTPSLSPSQAPPLHPSLSSLSWRVEEDRLFLIAPAPAPAPAPTPEASSERARWGNRYGESVLFMARS